MTQHLSCPVLLSPAAPPWLPSYHAALPPGAGQETEAGRHMGRPEPLAAIAAGAMGGVVAMWEPMQPVVASWTPLS